MQKKEEYHHFHHMNTLQNMFVKCNLNLLDR